MFRWLTPRCPVGTRFKAWTESRFDRLVELAGMPRLTSAELLLPTRQYFPEAFDPPPHEPEQILARVAEYLQLDVGEVGVRILPEEQQAWDATREQTAWNEPLVHVPETTLADAEALVALTACELSRIYLAQREAYTADDAEGPWAAELLAVVLGAGVFVANATIGEEHANQISLWRSMQLRRRGHLPARVIGYALALFAWARDERPRWTSYLRPDAARALTVGLRYLRRTGDSLFSPFSPRSQGEAVSPALELLAERLAKATPAERVAAMWEIAERGETSDAVERALVGCTSHRDAELRAEALRTLAAVGARSPQTEEAAAHALADADEDVRSAATRAAAALAPSSDQLIHDLAFLLEDASGEVVCGAAAALACYGRRADGQIDRILAALRRGLVLCHDPIVAAAVGALCAAAVDPAYCLCEKFSEDPEMLDQAVRALRDYGPGDDGAIE